MRVGMFFSGTISVQILSILFQCVDHVHGSNSLSFGGFGVDNRVCGDFQKHLIDEFPAWTV